MQNSSTSDSVSLQKSTDLSRSLEIADKLFLHAAELRSVLDRLSSADKDSVVAEFFRDYTPSGTSDSKQRAAVFARLMEQTAEKLALGDVWRTIFDAAVDGYSVFVESGSTTALAALGAAKAWLAHNEKRSIHAKFRTNNQLVQSALYGVCDCRLQYGEGVLAPKYVGYFPLSEDEIEVAEKDHRDLREQVTDTFFTMCQDARKFSQLVMTSSRFHFVQGPFVGSKQNAFLKSAYFSAGRHVAVLLDATKVLTNDKLADEKKNPNCIQVFDDKNSESGMSDRNPCVSLGLLDSVGRFKPCESWSATVRRIIEDQGSVTIHVSLPWSELSADAKDLSRRLGTAIKEFNNIHSSEAKRLHLKELQYRNVSVDPTSWKIVPSDSQGSLPIRILSYEYGVET